MVGGKVYEEQPSARMHRPDQLLELLQRRGVRVELGHGRVDGQEVGRGERATVFAHHRICRRHRERRQRLHDAEAHVVHDVRQAAHHLAERAELPRKDAVYGIGAAGLGGLHLDMRVAPLRPLRHGVSVREEASLA